MVCFVFCVFCDFYLCMLLLLFLIYIVTVVCVCLFVFLIENVLFYILLSVHTSVACVHIMMYYTYTYTPS